MVLKEYKCQSNYKRKDWINYFNKITNGQNKTNKRLSS